MLNGETEAQDLISKKLVNSICWIENMRIKGWWWIGLGCVHVCMHVCACVCVCMCVCMYICVCVCVCVGGWVWFLS